MEGNSERRRSPRFPCTGAAEILHGGQRWGWGKLSDISHGGCYIETDNPVAVGIEVRLRLTIADTLLDISARAVSITPLVGMGMEFLAVLEEQEIKLARIMNKFAAVAPSPAVPQTDSSDAKPATVHITREAAPEILAKVIERINQAGVLTRQELIHMVKSQTKR